MTNSIQTLSILGSGKVATALGEALVREGMVVRQVWSRTDPHAQQLAKRLKALPITKLAELDLRGVDLLLIAVVDSAIEPIARTLQSLKRELPLVVHTSGASPLTFLSQHLIRTGIFYPLQTFSPDRNLDLSSIPLCIEATQSDDAQRLLALGQKISRQTVLTSEQDRQTLHLAAVFVNNFVNQLYHIGAILLEEKNLPFSLLHPLIEETAAKVQTAAPSAMQTGPAIRKDQTTILKHLSSLESHPDWQTLYQVLTQLIQNRS